MPIWLRIVCGLLGILGIAYSVWAQKKLADDARKDGEEPPPPPLPMG